MNKLLRIMIYAQHWKERHGRNLSEYALAAGFVAVAASFLIPGVGKSISAVFIKVSSTLIVLGPKG